MHYLKSKLKALQFRLRGLRLWFQAHRIKRIKHQAILLLENTSLEFNAQIPFGLACLVGQNQYIDLLFSLKSLERVSNGLGNIYILSDGSLNEHQIQFLKNWHPNLKVYTNADTLSEELKIELPPILSQFYQSNCPVAPKLILGYLIQQIDNCLLMDSDIVWFNNPMKDVVFQNSIQQKLPFCMKDEQESYDHEIETFAAENGLHSKRFVNSGIVYLPNKILNGIDWTKILPNKPSLSYGFFAEQTAFSVVLNQLGFNFLPEKTYLVSLAGSAFPPDARQPFKDIPNHYTDLICRHFVSPVRNLMWLKAYRQLSKQII